MEAGTPLWAEILWGSGEKSPFSPIYNKKHANTEDQARELWELLANVCNNSSLHNMQTSFPQLLSPLPHPADQAHFSDLNFQ